ncbi:hypothetical protein [Aureitalea marina]|uniref:Uncharacterized protein n=1 Tax=Aureitalea marina TaxID=930804 RepID=A0A2S7KSP8_9FLAO|nr:hypothetical protein [Aureitalea marina]PQB05637.1 hypothetical protein BST85_12565 [Aureitalea marina]
MPKTTQSNSFSLPGIVCSVIGHHYVVTKKVTNHINEYKCVKCGKEMTDNDTGHLVKLNYRTKEINQALASLFQKKMRRLSAQ